MARGNEGWDFVKVGEIYQYKEDGMICMVRVLEDTSDEEWYKFQVKILASNQDHAGSVFIVAHNKTVSGYYSGMSQFYETPEYLPMPLGTPWPYFEEEEHRTLGIEAKEEGDGDRAEDDK